MRIPDIIQVFIIWTIIIVVSIGALFWSPISRIIISLTEDKIFIVFTLLAPGVIILFIYALAELFNILKNKHYTSASWQMSLLIFYCLFLVLFTGGISKSPLSPLVAIVPLISSPYYKIEDRRKILLSYVTGLVIVCILSHNSNFQPPSSYPASWQFTGIFDTVIITIFIIFGVFIELLILKLNEYTISQSSVVPEQPL